MQAHSHGDRGNGPVYARQKLRLLGAFLIGALLYQVVIAQFGGMAAAVAVPGAYFAWFGREHLDVALALLQLAAFALPAALLIAGGVLAAHRLLSGPATAVLKAVFCGLAACFVCWAVASVWRYPAPQATAAEILQQFMPPWWALPGVIAPWAGFALAAWIIGRTRPRSALH